MKYFKDYRVLSLPLGFESAEHQLYIKEHSERNQKSTGRTLFVGNVEYSNATSVEAMSDFLTILLESFGAIRSISVSAQGGSCLDCGTADSEGNRCSAWYCGGDFDARISCLANNTARVARFAHVTFESKSTLKYVMAASDSAYSSVFGKVVAKYGVGAGVEASTKGAVVTGNASGCRRWSSAELLDRFRTYKSSPGDRSDLAAIKDEVHSSLRAFEEREKQLLEEQEDDGEGEADDDGFILVKPKTKKKALGGRRNRAVGAGSNQAVQHQQYIQHISPSASSGVSVVGTADTVGAKKRKATELVNFYSFQKRESKAEVLLELRKQFEADREKIAAMKAQRKFKAL